MKTSIRLGDLELTPLLDGYFRLDGGAMFGVVPKPLWERRTPADERNRIQLATRPLLVHHGEAPPGTRQHEPAQDLAQSLDGPGSPLTGPVLR